MFGRFKGMFGRIKDEALTYVVTKEEDEKRDAHNAQNNENAAKEEAKHGPEVVEQYVEDA